MRALFFTELPDGKLRVRMIPEDRDPLLARIEANVRTLEQAIPFPCTKNDTTLRYIRGGKDRGKFEVSLTIACEKSVTKESAIYFLGKAGFTHTAR